MNENTTNDDTNQPITLNNEVTLDAAVFAAAASSTTAAAFAIAPDAHFLSSGLKLDTELVLKGNINNMDYTDTIETTPAPDSTDSDTLNAAAQYAGSTDSNSPYSLRNCKFALYSTNTMKN